MEVRTVTVHAPLEVQQPQQEGSPLWYGQVGVPWGLALGGTIWSARPSHSVSSDCEVCSAGEMLMPLSFGASV